MTTSEIALLDTNILVYAADDSSPFHAPSQKLRDKGLAGEITLCLCPQILTEFYAVITDSKRVTNPREPAEAIAEIKKYLSAKSMLKIYPGDGITEKMLELLEKYQVTRQSIFDVQLVATMLSHGITKIYTYNQEHFTKFGEIEVLSP